MTNSQHPLLVWLFQSGEPLHIDGGNARPMRAMNLSNALVQAGHSVVLWSSAFYHQEKRHRSLKARRIKVSDRLEIRLIPSRGYQRHLSVARLVDHATLALNLHRMLHHARSLPNVAFIGYPPIETAAVMARWLSRRGVPSLLDVKDQWPSLFINAAPVATRLIGRIMLRPYFYLARRAMQDSTGISTMANSFLDWALRFAERERNDADGVFPLTSPKGRIPTSELENARRWWDEQGIYEDELAKYCFVGNHTSLFDFKPVHEAAMIAARSAIPCEFVICGDGDYSVELRAMMSGLPNVHFPGWVDLPKIEILAERCQAAIAPYTNIENFSNNIPNKIIDALSLGLPVLCPLHGEVAALISEHGIGMRYGTDTGRRLHDCIQIMMRDARLRRDMSQRARALYAERFSFENVYGGLVKHLEKMAKLGPDSDYRSEYPGCPKSHALRIRHKMRRRTSKQSIIE